MATDCVGVPTARLGGDATTGRRSGSGGTGAGCGAHRERCGQRHREALAHLLYGLGEGGGFVQLTGEVGTGKEIVARMLCAAKKSDHQAVFYRFN